VVNGGKSALLTIYQPLQYDLSDYGVAKGLGWIMNCYFQEIEISTNQVLFEWGSLDYVNPSFSYVAPNTTESSGTGLQPLDAWDYL
jgi:Arylsulfotransferase (ASST)